MITLQHISKTFYKGTVNEVKSLQNVNLRIEEGDFITIVGSNGAGKSTLLNILAGTIAPDAGQVQLDGRDVTAEDTRGRSRWIGRIFQDPLRGTAGALTIEENLALASLRGGQAGLKKALTQGKRVVFQQRLAELGMNLEGRMQTPMELLSGGQRQGVAMVMATLQAPRLFLMDEPTAALDPRTGYRLMEVSERLVRQANLTTLMITHDLQHALTYGDRLIMMHQGRIVEEFDAKEKRRLKSSDLMAMFSDLQMSEQHAVLSNVEARA